MHNLQDFESTERYCTEVHDETKNHPDALNPLWIIVLEICISNVTIVNTHVESNELGKFALRIMQKYAKWIDPVRALKLLPQEIALESLLGFCEQVCNSIVLCLFVCVLVS